jgi:hypothetical protein
MTHKSKKSMNGTNILALILGFSALAVAIAALVNNKKDKYTDASGCCVTGCGQDDDGWCIGEDDQNNLAFKFNGTAVFTVVQENVMRTDDMVKFGEDYSLSGPGGGPLTACGANSTRAPCTPSGSKDFGVNVTAGNLGTKANRTWKILKDFK